MQKQDKRAFKNQLYEQFARIGKALSSAHRLELLEVLAQGEHSVEAVARETDMSIANASQHLQVLRAAQLVVVRREGVYIYYRLADEQVFTLWQTLRHVGEARIAEIDRIVDTYLHDRNQLQPIGASELLQRLVEDTIILLDVRPVEEYMAGHLPDALSMPVAELEVRLSELPQDREIVAYCRGPYCVFADEAVALLRSNGYNAQRLEQGLPDWRSLGLPVVSGKGEHHDQHRCRDIENMVGRGRPVTVLDIRPMRERVEWSIPGSMHIDAYDALKANDPNALADVAFPGDRPVVTVCAAGKTSLVAAQHLRIRGIQALSLEGGMKAWSLAWNIAEVPVAGGTVRILQVRRTGKGCLSYLIGTGKTAVVIDASLDAQVYLDLARHYGWQIERVLDTHIHADHLSRSHQLAQLSGATLFLPEQTRVSFPFTPIRDGDTFEIGTVLLTALRTPGHTSESTCYLLDRRVLLTGDTLFPTGVGRPDLAADADEVVRRASDLYTSLQTLLALPPETLVLPGHTSTPVAFDRDPIASTLADILEQVGVIHATREVFLQQILARIPPTPPNYERIVRFNEEGVFPERDVTELEAGANRCAIS